MPSNTDDGIVVVARAIFDALTPIAPAMDDAEGLAGLGDGERAMLLDAARAAIATYESHLRDKGMVVVPRAFPAMASLANTPSYPDCEGCKAGLSLACDSGGPWYHMTRGGEVVPHRQPLSASPVQSEG